MYTIRKAAALLGIPDRTLRGQMKRCGVGGKLINADGNRVYLSHEDMITLIGYSDRKRVKRVGKQIVGKGDILEMKDEDNDFQDGEKKAVYAIREAALIVGVSLSTMREWVLKHNIKKLRLNTDRKRVYIAYSDMLLLAELHDREIVNVGHADETIRRGEGEVQEDMGNKLYSIPEAAVYLNVTKATVSRWISERNIEKKERSADRRQTYITYNDVLMLAELYDRKVVSNVCPINIVEELKEVRGKLKALASEVEDIKHDFRVYVSRSIYVG